jgi:hypothetical protein
MRYMVNFHPAKLALYTALSIADLYCTYVLVQQTNGSAYEANPLAAVWLSRYGWSGLAFFKLMAVAFVTVVAMGVSWTRPNAGAFVLKFACTTTMVVILYSWMMMHVVARDLSGASNQVGSCFHIRGARAATRHSMASRPRGDLRKVRRTSESSGVCTQPQPNAS